MDTSAWSESPYGRRYLALFAGHSALRPVGDGPPDNGGSHPAAKVVLSGVHVDPATGRIVRATLRATQPALPGHISLYPLSLVFAVKQQAVNRHSVSMP